MRLGRGVKRDPSRVDIRYWSIKQIILRAYGLWPSQLAGPDWMDSVRLDISATIPMGAKADDFPGMLQWLLIERFSLAAHTETKNTATFALTVAKGGLKMKPAEPDTNPAGPKAEFGSSRIERVGRALESLWGDGAELGLKAMSTAGNAHLEFSRMPMDALAQFLSSYLRTPVIDRTGIEGDYQAVLDFSLADTPAVARATGENAAEGSFGTSLFAAILRLGLKLEPSKASIPVLVIDHLEQVPTAN